MSGQTLEQLKEQLKIKSAEIKKRDAEKSRQDLKIKHLMTITSKRLGELQSQLAEKEEQIRYQQKFQSAKYDPGSKTPDAPRTTPPAQETSRAPEKTYGRPLQPGRAAAPVSDEIKRALKELKIRNKSLIMRVEQERGKVDRLNREKTILAKEVRRLRKNPEEAEQVIHKVDTLETESEEARKSYQEIIEDKDRLIAQYESLMQNSVEGKGDIEFPSEIVEQIRSELKKVKSEKAALEKELIVEKKKYEVKLSHELQKVQDSYGNRKKSVQQTRRKLADLAEELQQDNTGSAYMTTYADMTTLLLTFFVLYYSLASINMNRFKEAILGKENASIGLLELMDAVESKEAIDVMTGLRSDDILSDINNVARTDTEKKIMEVSTDSSKIVVRVPGQTLFPPGSAELDIKASRPVLDELIRIVAKYPNYKISIQGHTDDTPIISDRYPSNWELSSARATAVLRYFIDKNIRPDRLTATGYADIFPIATNETELGQATNRRVEFVLEKAK